MLLRMKKVRNFANANLAIFANKNTVLLRMKIKYETLRMRIMQFLQMTMGIARLRMRIWQCLRMTIEIQSLRILSVLALHTRTTDKITREWFYYACNETWHYNKIKIIINPIS